MHIARRAIVSIAVLLASLSSILGQPHELLEVRLRSHVALLCADSLEGRKAGSEGGRMASEYIAEEWAAMGVDPLGHSYFHPFSLSRDTGRFHNVVARIEGEQSGNYIVVGAHYDHLGIVRGRIHPGADDNASGVAALLEVARLVAQSGIRPTHTLLFVAFDAEEMGLYGSEAFAKELPEGSIRAMVNMDMVGWLHEGTVVVEGTGTLRGSQRVLTQLAERHNIPIETKRFERSLMTATDTSPFASRQRIVAHQAGREIGGAALVAAFDRVVEHGGAAAEALFDDGVFIAQQLSHAHGPADVLVKPSAGGTGTEGVGIAEAENSLLHGINHLFLMLLLLLYHTSLPAYSRKIGSGTDGGIG